MTPYEGEMLICWIWRYHVSQDNLAKFDGVELPKQVHLQHVICLIAVFFPLLILIALIALFYRMIN